MIENPVADKMLLNTIYNHLDILEKFISARVSNQDTSNIVREFYNLSKVEEKYPNNMNLAEVIPNLIEEMILKHSTYILLITTNNKSIMILKNIEGSQLWITK